MPNGLGMPKHPEAALSLPDYRSSGDCVHTAQRLYASSSDTIPSSFFNGTNSCAT